MPCGVPQVPADAGQLGPVRTIRGQKASPTEVPNEGGLLQEGRGLVCPQRLLCTRQTKQSLRSFRHHRNSRAGRQSTDMDCLEQ